MKLLYSINVVVNCSINLIVQGMDCSFSRIGTKWAVYTGPSVNRSVYCPCFHGLVHPIKKKKKIFHMNVSPLPWTHTCKPLLSPTFCHLSLILGMLLHLLLHLRSLSPSSSSATFTSSFLFLHRHLFLPSSPPFSLCIQYVLFPSQINTPGWYETTNLGSWN